jgi:stearoyl-CoA desaturase (delta-9 desaturase)
MSEELKIKSLIVGNHILALAGLIFGNWNFLWLTLVGWILFGKVGGEIGFHRYFAHKSFITKKWKENILIFLGVFNCFGSHINWVGVHRKHHDVSDHDEDPHSPEKNGMLNNWLTLWKPFIVERKYVKDLLMNKLNIWVHRNYFKIILISMGLLALLNWQIPVYLICMSSVITFHSAGMVDTFCHKFGYRNFDTDDKSHNNTFVNILTLGSGLHNNHHADPTNWSNKVKKWEIDFPGWIIKTILMEQKRAS